MRKPRNRLPEDDDLDPSFDDFIEAADESEDPVTAEPSAPAPAAEIGLSESREAGEEASDEPLPDGERKKAALPHANEVRQLFSRLQVRREASGKIHIEAPAEVASTLSALFEGIASLLQSTSEPLPIHPRARHSLIAHWGRGLWS